MAELAPAGARCSFFYDNDLRIERRRIGTSWACDSNWSEHEIETARREAIALRERMGPEWEVRLVRVRFEVLDLPEVD